MHRTFYCPLHSSLSCLIAVVMAMVMLGSGCDDGVDAAPAAGTPATTTATTGTPAAASASGGVAVIDLEAVLDGLGRRDAWTTELLRLERAETERVQSLGAQLQADFDRRKAELGEGGTDEQQQQLARTGQMMQARLQEEAGLARERLAKRRQDIITGFRNEMRPVALAVAKSRGLGVVLEKSDAILAAQPEHDITQAVLQRAQEMGMSAMQRRGNTGDAPTAPTGPTAPEAPVTPAPATP